MKDLMNPEAFPEPTEKVSLIQTHISMVFLGDKYVYKVKKPVDFGFLDFSTLEKRLHFCKQEIDLNRRFSKGLYVNVVPIYFNGTSHTIGDGDGEIVDYAVKMCRLSDELLMKSFFDRKELQAEHLNQIAKAIAEFHLNTYQSSEIDKFGDPDVFKFTTNENFEQTEKYIDTTIALKDYHFIQQWTNLFFIDHRELFFERMRSKKIRDCHGDLHMEHICLSTPVSMFDCIEFNDRLRYTDTLADIGFLLMDLEYRGGTEFADILWKTYSEITGDSDMESLLTFYKIYRAYVRGKVISFQIDDERITPEKKAEAIETANKYFLLARSYIV